MNKTKTITMTREAWERLNEFKPRFQKGVRKGKVTHSHVILGLASAFEEQEKKESK